MLGIVAHFLNTHGLWNSAISWSMGLGVGFVIPVFRRMWKAHREELSRIVDLLDTETEGGIAELKRLVEEVLERL